MMKRAFAILALCAALARAQAPANISPIEQFCNMTYTPATPADLEFLGTMQYVNLTAGDLAYYRFGNHSLGNPALVMVPGFGATMSSWPLRMLETLAETQEVVIMDNVGQGFSTNNFPNDTLTISGMAYDVIGLIEHMNFEQNPNLLGWSMGGMIVLTAVAQNSTQLNKIVSISGSPGSINSPRPTPEAIAAELNPGSNPVDGYDLLFDVDTEEGKDLFCTYFLDENRLVDNSNMETTASQAKALVQYFLTDDATYNAMPSIENDMYLLGGSDDVLVPVGGLRYVTDVAPYPWFTLFRGARHASFYQYYDQFMTILETFLSIPDRQT